MKRPLHLALVVALVVGSVSVATVRAARADGPSCSTGLVPTPDPNGSHTDPSDGTRYSCVTTASLEFALDDGNYYVEETDTGTATYAVSGAVLDTGYPPIHNADGSWSSGGPTAASLSAPEPAVSAQLSEDVVLKARWCKKIDTKHVTSYTCWRRYKLREGDQSENYNLVWYTGTAHTKNAVELECQVTPAYRCMTWEKNQISIAHRSKWCRDVSFNKCGLVDWAPNSCCMHTGDGVQRTESLTVSVGSVSASMSRTFTTWKEQFGLWWFTPKFYSRGWGTGGKNENTDTGRGQGIVVGTAGGIMYAWSADHDRPPVTVATLLRDSKGYVYG